jgi:spermidine synthase
MLASQTLECVATPDGLELVLYQRGDVFHITIDRFELMSSRAHRSEEELARLAVIALGGRPAPRLLVGGLGMGFTVRAALDAVARLPGATVTVAEVFEAVIRWNRGPLAPLAGAPLDDPRVTVVHSDVGDLLASEAMFDAILLDVDNGPQGLTRKANQLLYSDAGLAHARRALRPGGLLAVWSASPDAPFEKRMRRAGYETDAVEVSARAGAAGPMHTLFFGRVSSLPAPSPRGKRSP